MHLIIEVRCTDLYFCLTFSDQKKISDGGDTSIAYTPEWYHHLNGINSRISQSSNSSIAHSSKVLSRYDEPHSINTTIPASPTPSRTPSQDLRICTRRPKRVSSQQTNDRTRRSRQHLHIPRPIPRLINESTLGRRRRHRTQVTSGEPTTPRRSRRLPLLNTHALPPQLLQSRPTSRLPRHAQRNRPRPHPQRRLRGLLLRAHADRRAEAHAQTIRNRGAASVGETSPLE